MTCRHLGILTLLFACLLLVPSWSDNIDGDRDKEHNAGEPNEHSEKEVPEKNIEKRSINEKKSKKKYKHNKNKKPKQKNKKTKNKKSKQKNKKTKNKNPKDKKPIAEDNVSCGFNDDELLTNGTNRSPWDISSRYVWDYGRIPYYFKGTVSYWDKALFRRAMAKIHAKTCFRFVEIYSQPNYHHLEITVGTTSCWPGFSGYVSAISNTRMILVSEYRLTNDNKCNWEGNILHELMHALGVGHTQKRRDRNDYITVHDGNIKDPYQYSICTGCTNHPSIPYDCNSVMHYGYNTLKKSGHGPTMTARNPNCCKLTEYGQRSGATDNDWNLLKIIAAKVCKASCTGTSNEWECCTSSSPCQELHGDCDSDSDCAGSLVCGYNNCKDFYGDKAQELADCCIKPEVLSFCANDWDGPLQYQCPSGQSISRMVSYHDNGREDRRWHFQCTRASFIQVSCEWSSYTQYDERIDYQCSGPDGVLVALESHHDNGREDRIWKFKCCSSTCFWTGWINWWDGYMNYHVPNNYHIAGVFSYHDNGREDRRWQLRLCKNPSNSRSSIIDDAEKERIRNSTINISAEDIGRLNALFPSQCPQTETCLRAGGTCQKENENEENEQGQGKVKGKGKNNGKGKGKGKGKPKGKGKRKQQEHGNNLCKHGCKCMITI